MNIDIQKHSSIRKGSDILRGKFVKGLTAGALIGAAAGMLLVPGMDKKTRKRMIRTGKKVSGFASDLWDDIMHFKK